jgi:hypothetical protein
MSGMNHAAFKCFEMGKLTVLTIAHDSSPPDESVWDAYIATLKAYDDKHKSFDNLRTIALTDGGAPNVKQRGQINDLLKGRPLAGAVISDSALVRAIVTALSWFNPSNKSFSPAAVHGAVRHLGLDARDVPVLKSAFSVLAEQLPSCQTLAAAIPSLAQAQQAAQAS